MFQNFKWLNQTDVIINENSLIMRAAPKTDFFIDPKDGRRVLSGAYFYQEVNRDFILNTKVTPTFESTYDACALLVMSDETCWAKLCFEFTDIGTYSVVSVVTDGLSDDANGVDVQGESVYLQIVKQGDLFAMHYSLDGKAYKMVRYFSLPMQAQFKVGFVAQSPTGNGGNCAYDDIKFGYHEVKNMRSGI